MYNILKYIYSIIALTLSTQAITQQAGYKFIENKGQFPKEVYFKTDLRAGNLYFEKNRLLFDLYDVETFNKYIEAHYNKELKHTITELKCHAYAVNFIGANPNHSIEFQNKTDEYYNYYLGNDSSKWASKAYGYFRIGYKDLYPNVDLKIYSKVFNLKYDFIVHPGQSPGVIQLNYEGADNIAIKNGRLHIYTSVNHVIEDKPYAYQLINNQKIEVPCNYKLIDNNLSFDFPEGYNENYDLIIDPTLMFSTYSGSTADNFGYSATFDSQGFLYSGSSAFGQGYPVVTGSYNINFTGGIVDMAISKFDTTGTFLIYSTYIGGSSDELPHSLIVNSLDELFILGTTSSTNFPYTTGCFDSTFNGGTPNNLQNGLGVYYVNGSDIVVSHISSDGANLLGSTYIGGSQNDGLNSISSTPSLNTLRYNYADEVRGEIDIDHNNNIYIVSCTRSSDFPTTPNTVQPIYGGGAMDACVFKLDNGLQNLIWSSFIGGSGTDAGYSLAIDKYDDIYIAGGTNSTDLTTTTGVLYPTFQGGRSDGFITKLSANGQSVLNSTYFGSTTYDQTYFVELDRYDNVYLFGQTETTSNQFIVNATYSNPGSGQVITKLSPQMDSIIYSTVFGSGNGINISPTAFLVDYCNKIYLAGWGGAVNNISTLDNNAGYTFNMPISANAYQNTTDGSDFYVMVMQDDASALVYGSYFGGAQSPEHVDGGTSRFDRKGKVYQAICAGCGGYSDLPIYPSNAVSATNNNSCNLGVFKMDFDLPVVVADFDTPPIGCAPYTYTFNNTSLSQNYTSYEWDFGDGNGTSSQLNPTYTYNQTGTYTITLVVKDTSTCNFNDTIQKTITIIGDTSYSLTSASICPGEQIQIGFAPNGTSNLTYQWSPQNTLSADNVSNPFATPVSTTIYQLLISNGVCTDTVTQQVVVNTPLVDLTGNNLLCEANATSNLSANSFGTSTSYVWSTNSDFTTILQSGTNNTFLASPANEGTIYVQVDNNGCTTLDSISINYVPEGNIVSSSNICFGDTLNFNYQNSELDNPVYNWFGGTSISGSTQQSFNSVSPYSDSVYLVVNNGGCVDTLVANYNIYHPLLSVSNDTTICSPNQTISLTANSSGTVSSFIWSTNNLFNDTINSPLTDSTISIAPNSSGYYYSLIDLNGCALIDSVLVTYIPEGSLQSLPQICYGDTLSFNYQNTEIVSPTYNWTGGNAITPSNQLTFSTIPPYSDSVFLIVTNGGCIDTLIANYTVYSPTLNISNDTTLCTENEIITLTANSNGTADSFIWSNSTTFSDTINTFPNDSVITVNPTNTGYLYSQINDHGCILVDSVFITVATSQLTLNNDATICFGDSITLTAINQNPTDTITLDWQPDSLIMGDNTQYSVTVTPTATTTFFVNGTNQSGCVINESVTIDVDQTSNTLTTVTATPDSIFDGQSSLLNATPSGYSYSWSPSTGLSSLTTSQTQASPESTTTYYVQFTSSNGCVKTDSITVYILEIICGEPDVYVPNAFTPNSDGKNDILYVRGNFIQSILFRVYDRWGELVFETTDQSQGWDGTYKGKPCDPAVFDYYLETVCWTEEKYFKKGNITLIR